MEVMRMTTVSQSTLCSGDKNSKEDNDEKLGCDELLGYHLLALLKWRGHSHCWFAFNTLLW